jgi:hypothetical protein
MRDPRYATAAEMVVDLEEELEKAREGYEEMLAASESWSEAHSEHERAQLHASPELRHVTDEVERVRYWLGEIEREAGALLVRFAREDKPPE